MRLIRANSSATGLAIVKIDEGRRGIGLAQDEVLEALDVAAREVATLEQLQKEGACAFSAVSSCSLRLGAALTRIAERVGALRGATLRRRVEDIRNGIERTIAPHGDVAFVSSLSDHRAGLLRLKTSLAVWER